MLGCPTHSRILRPGQAIQLRSSFGGNGPDGFLRGDGSRDTHKGAFAIASFR